EQRMALLGHPRPRRSKPHHGACPLCLRKRTLSDTTSMSALCQSRLNALQQTTSYSITSSARASRVGGIVRASALSLVSFIIRVWAAFLEGAAHREESARTV